jgi:hypothetical protein
MPGGGGAEIFYPEAVSEIRRRGRAEVPYEVLERVPPRDVAYKDIRGPRGASTLLRGPNKAI